MTAADVNGDGKPDLIVANYRSQHGVGAAEHDGAGATTPSFAAQQTFATGSSPSLGDGGGLERRRQARPDRRELRLEHGVGAAEHDGAGRHHALLRRPADLRHRQRARSP